MQFTWILSQHWHTIKHSQWIEVVNIDNIIDNIDGDYVVVDIRREIVICSGTAAVDTDNRWKEHTVSSLFKDHNKRSNKF